MPGSSKQDEVANYCTCHQGGKNEEPVNKRIAQIVLWQEPSFYVNDLS
jgi:hypothetical protein